MNEDVFNGVRAALVFFDGFYKEVLEELGEEKTLSLLNKMEIAMGKMQGRMLKGQARREKIKDITPSIALSLAGSVFERLGIEVETLSETPEKVTLNVKRCPVYEAGKIMGMNAEKLCRQGAVKRMDTMVKQLNPNLSYELDKYRTSSEDFCSESIVLKKELLIEK